MKKNLWQIIVTPAHLVIQLLFTFSSFIATTAEAQQPDSWQRKQNFGNSPSPRESSFTFSIGDKGYAGTGYYGVLKSDFWEYDPAKGTWSQKADFAGGTRAGAIGFSIGGKGYAGMGSSGDLENNHPYNDLWEYDPLTNQWVTKASLPGDHIDGGVSFSIGNKGYFGTGSIKNGPGKDFWEYDPAIDTWTKKGDFQGIGRINATGFGIGSKGYIGLGQASGKLNDFWEYDPAADRWTQKNNFPGVARYGAVGITVGSKGYVGVGIGDTYEKDWWEYEATSDSWTRRSDFIGVVHGGIFAFTAGGRGYLGSSNDHENFWEFNPANNTWKDMTDLGEQGRINATGFSIGNKGYFGTGARGYIGAALCRDFWEYDPEADSWSQKADFGGTARKGAIGLSIGNKGYIGTGKDASGEKNDFWEYDPANNTWIQKSNYPEGMVSNAKSFTVNNKGYIIERISRHLWEYDPGSDKWTQKATITYESGIGDVGFAIGNKGYYGGANYNDFFEYDPAADTWTRKASILKTLEESYDLNTANITGFSIGNKGYITTGREYRGYKDPPYSDHLYEYDPEKDTWTDRARFPGTGREYATGISIGNKGYVCFGLSYQVGMLSDLWEYTPVNANTITTNLTATEFCSLKPFFIPYSVGGTFNPGNTFTAQISNASGSFANAIAIGNVNSITGGTITATIPANIPPGTAYRIRVIASSPVITGSVNEGNLSVNPPPLIKTKNITVYLDAKGQVTIAPAQLNGSTGYCGGLTFQLDKTRFNCANLGANKVTLTVKDCNGNTSKDTAIVKVRDTISPFITGVLAFPGILWPPDNKMKEVTLFYRVADNCMVKSIVLSVTSNELPLPYQPDWVIVNNHRLLLRASNFPGNKERTYTISVTARDGCGNIASRQVTVRVAHWPKHHYDPCQSKPGTPFVEQENKVDLGAERFTVNVQPNPAVQYFTIITRSDNNGPIMLRIIDAGGKVIEQRNKVAVNSTVQLGERYLPGTYYLQAIQQKEMVTIKLVKGGH